MSLSALHVSTRQLRVSSKTVSMMFSIMGRTSSSSSSVRSVSSSSGVVLSTRFIDSGVLKKTQLHPLLRGCQGTTSNLLFEQSTRFFVSSKVSGISNLGPDDRSNAAIKRFDPNFYLRTGLVALSTGVFTPFFSIVGIGIMWQRYLPQSIVGTAIKYALGIFGGMGIVSIIQQHVFPFLMNHPDVVFPFCVANGITAGFWYAILEKKMGLEFMAGLLSVDKFPSFIQPMLRLVGTHYTTEVVGMNLVGMKTGSGAGSTRSISQEISEALKSHIGSEPVKNHLSENLKTATTNLEKNGAKACSSAASEVSSKTILALPCGGILIGVLTAGTSFLLFPICCDQLLNSELKEFMFPHGTGVLADLFTWILLPVGLPCGICCGYAMHYLLGKTMIDSGFSRRNVIHPPLQTMFGGFMIAFILYFFGYSNSTMSVNELKWESRLNPKTGELYSENVVDGRIKPGLEMADNASRAREILGISSYLWSPKVDVLTSRSVFGFFKGVFECDDEESDMDPRFPDFKSQKIGSIGSIPRFPTNKFKIESRNLDCKPEIPLAYFDEHQRLMSYVDLVLRYRCLKQQGGKNATVETISVSSHILVDMQQSFSYAKYYNPVLEPATFPELVKNIEIEIYRRKVHGDTNTKSVHGHTNTKSVHGHTNTKSVHGDTNTKSVHGHTNTKSVHGHTNTKSVHGDTDTKSVHGHTNTNLTQVLLTEGTANPDYSIAKLRKIKSMNASRTNTNRYVRKGDSNYDNSIDTNDLLNHNFYILEQEYINNIGLDFLKKTYEEEFEMKQKQVEQKDMIDSVFQGGEKHLLEKVVEFPGRILSKRTWEDILDVKDMIIRIGITFGIPAIMASSGKIDKDNPGVLMTTCVFVYTLCLCTGWTLLW